MRKRHAAGAVQFLFVFKIGYRGKENDGRLLQPNPAQRCIAQ